MDIRDFSPFFSHPSDAPQADPAGLSLPPPVSALDGTPSGKITKSGGRDAAFQDVNCDGIPFHLVAVWIPRQLGTDPGRAASRVTCPPDALNERRTVADSASC